MWASGHLCQRPTRADELQCSSRCCRISICSNHRRNTTQHRLCSQSEAPTSVLSSFSFIAQHDSAGSPSTAWHCRQPPKELCLGLSVVPTRHTSIGFRASSSGRRLQDAVHLQRDDLDRDNKCLLVLILSEDNGARHRHGLPKQPTVCCITQNNAGDAHRRLLKESGTNDAQRAF